MMVGGAGAKYAETHGRGVGTDSHGKCHAPQQHHYKTRCVPGADTCATTTPPETDCGVRRQQLQFGMAACCRRPSWHSTMRLDSVVRFFQQALPTSTPSYMVQMIPQPTLIDDISRISCISNLTGVSSSPELISRPALSSGHFRPGSCSSE